MRFLIVGDLHGHMPKIQFSKFDAIIAPGDFCSDALRTYMFQALKERLHDKKSKVTWYGLAGRRVAKQMIQQSLADGRAILEQLNTYGVPVYIVPGNWDWTPEKDAEWNFLQQDHYRDIVKGLEHIVDTHHKLVDIGEYQMIGHGISSGPEFPVRKEDKDLYSKTALAKVKKSYERTKRKVSSLFDEAQKPIIFLSHNVPHNTPLDIIVNPASPRNGLHHGSIIAREMIDAYQPLVCIGGHMHEHFASCNVGKTTVINAGFGSYVNVLLEVKGRAIKQVEFYRGE